MCLSLGQYDRAIEYLEKALFIRTVFGDKKGEAADLANLGVVSRNVGDYEASEVYLEKALSISKDIVLLQKKIRLPFVSSSVH